MNKEMEKKTSRSWLIFIFLFAVILLNGFFLNHKFPVKEVFSDKIMTSSDYSFHYALLALFRQEPNFSVPELIYAGDLKLASLILFFIPTVILSKLYVFATLLFSPLIFYFAAKNYYKSGHSGIWGCVLLFAVVNFSPLFWDYLQRGIYYYDLACIVLIAAISYFLTVSSFKEHKKIIVFLIFSGWAFLIHPFSIFYSLLALTAYCLVYLKKFKFLSLIFIGLIFLIPVLNSPLASSHHISDGVSGFMNSLQYFPMLMSFFIFALFALAFKYKGKDKIFWTLLLLFVFIFTYYFGMIEMFSGYQIKRELFFFLLCVFVSIPVFSGKKFIAVLAVLFILFTLFTGKDAVIYSYNQKFHFGIFSDIEKMKTYFENNPHNYVWFEQSSYWTNFTYGYGHTDRVFYYWLDKKAILSPYLTDKTKRRDLFFADGEIKNSRINESTPAFIMNLAWEHNITHIVYYSREAKQFFSDFNKTCFKKICVAEIGIKQEFLEIPS